MNCIVCGAEVQNDEQKCSDCREMDSKVQILSREERQQFNGVTLEQDDKEHGHTGYERSNTNQKIFIKQFSMGNTNLLNKIVIGIILAVILVVALPIALFLISIVGIFLFFIRK